MSLKKVIHLFLNIVFLVIVACLKQTATKSKALYAITTKFYKKFKSFGL